MAAGRLHERRLAFNGPLEEAQGPGVKYSVCLETTTSRKAPMDNVDERSRTVGRLGATFALLELRSLEARHLANLQHCTNLDSEDLQRSSQH